MFEVYEVEAWRLFGGWILSGLTAIGLAVFWRMAVVLNRSNGRAQATIKSREQDAASWKSEAITQWQKALLAEANARESSAAHEEAVKKLNALTLVAAEMETELNRLTPKRLKDGKFAPKSGKTGEKKKVSRK